MKHKDMHGKHTPSSGKWLVLGGGRGKRKRWLEAFSKVLSRSEKILTKYN